jgi:hypothetical protein
MCCLHMLTQSMNLRALLHVSIIAPGKAFTAFAGCSEPTNMAYTDADANAARNHCKSKRTIIGTSSIPFNFQDRVRLRRF